MRYVLFWKAILKKKKKKKKKLLKNSWRTQSITAICWNIYLCKILKSLETEKKGKEKKMFKWFKKHVSSA